MPTARLYHHDSFQRTFTGTVVAHGTWRDRPSLILDRTAFYPEAGGQMADRGTLGGAAIAIVDVQADDDGLVHHVVDADRSPGGEPALPAPGAAVDGAIDWPRRRLHMSLHTGQHVLSRALLDTAGAATLSARLGDTCTIDLDRPLDDAAVAAAEALACAVIDDDLPIRAWFPEPAELAALPLRREPKVDSDVRIIAVGDFDVSPCGGTHCASSGQIGALRILGAERYKGGTRVTFAAGGRARAELASRDATLRQLAAWFTCSPAEVPTAVDKLRRDLAANHAALKDHRERLAAALAAHLLLAPGAVIAAVPSLGAQLGGADAELLRAIAARVTAAGRDALLAAPGPDGTAVMLARGAGGAGGAGLDCGATLTAITRRVGGRGGGKPDRAEGRLPAGIDWPAVVAEVLP